MSFIPMNIFWLHRQLSKNAEYYHNKHVIKIILEIAQMLWAVHHRYGLADNIPVKVYRATHAKHPCTLWCGDSLGNYRLAAKMGIALCLEYTFRYEKQHKCQEIIEWLLTNPPANIPISGKISCPPLCMPEEFQCPQKPVTSYRKYYLAQKINEKSAWTKRPRPAFAAFKQKQ